LEAVYQAFMLHEIGITDNWEASGILPSRYIHPLPEIGLPDIG